MAINDKKPVKKLKFIAHKVASSRKGFFRIFISIGGYFKGAWKELRQVRWPDRKSAWGMTMAVILFTGFFVAMIVLLDYVFKLLFELILK